MIKLDHIRIAVKDWQASRDWYVGNLGLKVEFEIPDGGSERLGVATLQDDAGLTLFLEQTSDLTNGCECIFYFQVDSVDEMYRRLSLKEVPFLAAPQKFFWGYGAELADPDEHVIRVWDESSMEAK